MPLKYFKILMLLREEEKIKENQVILSAIICEHLTSEKWTKGICGLNCSSLEVNVVATKASLLYIKEYYEAYVQWCKDAFSYMWT